MARVMDASALYESVPDGPEQPLYLNAAVAVETGLEPLPLLRFLKGIEHEIGRRPGSVANGPRPIDIDLLLYAQEVIDTDELRVPHPRLAERAFVLVPLADIAAGVVHPVLVKPVAELLDAAGSEGVIKVEDKGWDGVAGYPAGRVRL
jgi:2-amino-4-hydroxy-6-hydroxymethyldihydropteridine diphosphokinase